MKTKRISKKKKPVPTGAPPRVPEERYPEPKPEVNRRPSHHFDHVVSALNPQGEEERLRVVEMLTRGENIRSRGMTIEQIKEEAKAMEVEAITPAATKPNAGKEELFRIVVSP